MRERKPQEKFLGTMDPTSGGWSLQAADWRDFSQLTHLERICFQEEDIWPFWDLIGILTLPGLVRIKAEVEGTMIGFIGGERKLIHQVGWITTLAVLPAYRQQGVARSLLSRCEDRLAMPTLRLTVRASNQAAVGLYERAGYNLVDRWEKYYAGGEDGLVFEKSR